MIRPIDIELVRQGLSPYRFRPGVDAQHHEALIQAEREAYAARRGIWSDPVLRNRIWSERQEWAADAGIPTPRLGLGQPTQDIGWLGRESLDDLTGLALALLLLAALGLTRKARKSKERLRP